MICACIMVYSLPCHKDTLLSVVSRLRLQYEKAVSEHLLYVKWKAKRMSVPMLVFSNTRSLLILEQQRQLCSVLQLNLRHRARPILSAECSIWNSLLSSEE